MKLDLEFLSAARAINTSAPRPVNVYEILREGWRETRVDMTLQFFLDPTERHGLGSLVIDAFLALLDGAPVVTDLGASGPRFRAEDFQGSDAWEISTQVDFIDVYAVNRELSAGVVLENKIAAELNNPLDAYAARARKDLGPDATLLVAVLAPQVRSPSAKQAKWLSRSITYRQLSEEIKRDPRLLELSLAPADLDQRRSVDLLQQFMEVRNGAHMSDVRGEAATIDGWRALMEEHRDAVRAFEEARRRAGRLMRDRNKRLEPLIGAELAKLHWSHEWESHGSSNSESWNAYHFPALDWTVELKLSIDPGRPSIFVYDYRGRTYKDSTIEPLGQGWDADDQEVAEVFGKRVMAVLERVQRTASPR